MVEIVTLASTFTDSGKDRVTSVSLGNIVDQLHDQDGLADSGTTEQTDLSSLGVGGQEVDDLDSVKIKEGKLESTNHGCTGQAFSLPPRLTIRLK